MWANLPVIPLIIATILLFSPTLLQMFFRGCTRVRSFSGVTDCMCLHFFNTQVTLLMSKVQRPKTIYNYIYQAFHNQIPLSAFQPQKSLVYVYINFDR